MGDRRSPFRLMGRHRFVATAKQTEVVEVRGGFPVAISSGDVGRYNVSLQLKKPQDHR